MSDGLAGWIVKWLTHDFASPISSLYTASELLSNHADPEINALVQAGTGRLVVRLRLVRTALAPGDAPIGGAALERLVSDGVEGTPVTWRCTSADAEGQHAAVIAGAVMLLADLRRGQPLTVTDTGVHWDSPASLPPAVAAAIAGDRASDGRSALAVMVREATARAGMTLALDPNGLRWTMAG